MPPYSVIPTNVEGSQGCAACSAIPWQPLTAAAKSPINRTKTQKRTATAVRFLFFYRSNSTTTVPTSQVISSFFSPAPLSSGRLDLKKSALTEME